MILIAAGCAAGFLNTVASSGSAVTLPVLIMVGAAPVTANATNRVPIVIGVIAALWRFHRAGHLPVLDGLRLAVPVVIGAAAGALTASRLSDTHTAFLVTFAIVLALIVVCANPSKWLAADAPHRAPRHGPVVMVLMGMVGGWAGLITVDASTYALAVLVLVAGYAIREANAIKLLTMGLAALVSLLIFAEQGQINWTYAALLSVGSVVGALLGSRLALGAHAARWVFRLLVLVLVLEAVRLGVTLLSA